ncbi:hypothetical protein B6S12_07650 [Helicobacter valdiviensis]|uniref:Coiled-coil domain-containing protein n=1 Tax=Helicobacter valdiviensis TaxID=1458358 RepID=A0A2W6MTC2_9HELI|nr:hypothetical protein [Helicobacter valdiviensis]PZT47727.1 hypothetical protein B6S12_07650 [Helicobacter valdiviensis]
MNEFDTQEEEKELAALSAEIEQIQASLEADFVGYAVENTTEEDENLFFDNRAEFYTRLLEKQNAFFEEKIANKQKRVGELQTSIQEKKTLGAVEAAKNEFLKANPNVDINALMQFFIEDLPPKVKASLEKLEPLEFFNALYKLFLEANDKKEELPQKLEGVSAEAQSNGGDDNPLNRY